MSSYKDTTHSRNYIVYITLYKPHMTVLANFFLFKDIDYVLSYYMYTTGHILYSSSIMHVALHHKFAVQSYYLLIIYPNLHCPLCICMYLLFCPLNIHSH